MTSPLPQKHSLPKRLVPALALALLTLLPGCSQSQTKAPDKAIFIPQATGAPATPPQDTEP